MKKTGSKDRDVGESLEMKNLTELTKKLLKVSKAELDRREAEERKRKADS